MSRKKELQKNRPNAPQEVFDLAEQFDTNHELKALADTEGGKQLVELLLKDVVATVGNIAGNRAKWSLAEFQAAGADLDTKLNLLRVITRAKENEQFLDEMIADALAE